LQKEYEDEFLKSKFTFSEYIRRLQRWRDRYERNLDSRPRLQPLDLLSHYLTEFQHGKFDDIEIPGQYTEESSIRWLPSLSVTEPLIGQGQPSELR
jgi:transformation/transcription domain-associated protein